ncbi:MAG: tetratricopeptide repeat protein [Burkholderiales bacterium]|nr:tetratricopeptide repeat protein [Burkholderiales bacterium]
MNGLPTLRAPRFTGDGLRLGCALHALGSAHAAEGDPEAEAALIEAHALLEPTGPPRLIAMARGSFALMHVAHCRIDEAIAAAKESLDFWRETGADRSVLRTRNSLADLAWAKGELDEAIAASREVRGLM